MLVALSQMDMGFQQIEQAKIKVEKMVKEASQKHCDLIIFPEMTLTGFTMKQIVDSSTIPFFDRLSSKYHITIIYGLIEQGYYNSCNITDGKVQTNYQKIHPFLKESQYYQKGDHLVSYTMNDFTIVPTICYDLRFPILYYKASLLGNMIVNIASWPDARDEHWLALLKARAIENQCYVIGVNRVGNDPACHYIGHSVVFDGWGNQLNALSEKEENIYVEIELKDYPSRFIDDRRHELYIKLLSEE